jgi:hypothetical protein
MPFYSDLRKKPGLSESAEKQRKRTITGLKTLRTALAAHFKDSGDRGRTLRIGTWNLREFGGSKHGGRKDYEPLYYIAEIVSNFDIAAIQEVRGNLSDFLRLKGLLGPDWDYLATDVTDGDAGNGERMVFLYNRRRVQFRNIAGELTLPDGKKVLAAFGERMRLQNGLKLALPAGTDLSGTYRAKSRAAGSVFKLDEDLEIPIPAGASLTLPEGCALAILKNSVIDRAGTGKVKANVPIDAFDGKTYGVRFPGGILDESFKQFARTPYIVTFQAGWLKLNLCTVHIYFGDNEEPKLLKQRRDEIAALVDSLGARALEDLERDPMASTLTAVLGDFNIISAEHDTMKALERAGFVVPEKIKAIPGSNVAKDKTYDQIAFWEPERDRGYIKVEITGAGVFDYYKHVYRLDQAAEYDHGSVSFKEWRTYKMSDHLPMWVELRSDFSDEYLANCEME